jgi:hypothetical protein
LQLVTKGIAMSRDANDFAEHLRPARRCFSILSIALLAFLTLSFAPAAAQVVALGASNTEGRGVAGSAAWPAQLERMLRAKGYNVQVKNAGVSGDDTRRMLGRLNSTVPEGTRVVILEKPRPTTADATSTRQPILLRSPAS